MNYKDYFKGKRITIMGIDPGGRGVQDAAFLSECGAIITATDLRYEPELVESLRKLKTYENIQYVLGEHRMQDFENVDLVVRAASVPLDSKYLLHAKENGVQIESDETLFLKFAPNITSVGVTGTRGKSSVVNLIHHIVKESGKHVHFGGNVRGVASLPLLEHVEEGDIVVFELDSWKLQQFGESHMSPDISVFTTFYLDHMDYYKKDTQRYFDDKANIFKFQKKGDVFITTTQAHGAIERYSSVLPDNEIIAAPAQTTNPSLLGEHSKENAGCAFEVGKALHIDDAVIQKAIDSFEGVEGRLQFVREVDGVEIYNDNNATSPDATIAALKALGEDIVLILGGSDKGLAMHNLIAQIPLHCKGVVLLDGTGTALIKEEVQALSNLEVVEAVDLKDSVSKALRIAEKGDTLLFSPAFASFGLFENEYDRNDQFLSLVEKL